MADAKIINYGQPIGAGSTAIPDNTSTALDIESTDAKDYITVDTTDGDEKLMLGTGTRQDMMRFYGANGIIDGNTGTYGINSIATASATVPPLLPNKNDQDTGIGAAGADQLSLIAGGVEGIRIEEASGTARPMTIGSVATALDGTFTATNGSTAISSGSSTAVTTQLHVGSAIEIFEGSTSRGVFTVSAIASDTALTLDSTVSGLSSSPKTGMAGKTDGGELFAVKTGDSKTLFGVNSTGAVTCGTALDLTKSSNNIAFGQSSALDLITSGKRNHIIGHAADNYKITSGYRNIIQGYSSGEDLATGHSNVIIGDSAGTVCNDNENAYIGAGSGLLCTGKRNAALGSQSCRADGDADNCVAVGYNSLYANTGNNNVAVGYQAGDSLTSGEDCTFLGTDADASSTATDDNQTAIGHAAVAQGANTIMLGDSNISGLHCYDTSISSPSDSRIKENVQDSALGLDFINALRPVKYQKKHPSEFPEEIREKRWSDQERTETDLDGNDVLVVVPAHTKPDDWESRTEYGLIAQEVKVAMGSHNADDWQGHKTLPSGMEALGYGNLVTVLVKAVQELTARVAELEAGD